MSLTEYQATYFAHELSRRYSLSDSEKLAPALADAQVDLNPHQLDAALFAFRSPLSKGCILADEVGLGKTIEAGLVIAQKWSERKRHILIITPANLRKQWAMEMSEKFYLPSYILEAKNFRQLQKDGRKNPWVQDALIICSYQFAAKNSDKILALPWDLAVIDEAHRLRNVYKSDNKIAKAIKAALGNTQKLLLTATPLQNSLMELYGLASVIDEYAFGDEKSYKAQYARLTSETTFDELKARLAPICHRTLRRQVLEYIRYTNRIPLTEDFYPSDDETALYDMVTEYLQRKQLFALPNSQRQLITLILRKLLASSTFAIAGALESLANRLKKQVKATQAQNALTDLAQDFEAAEADAEEWDEEQSPDPIQAIDIAAIEAEISELELFRDLAVSISENAKGQALVSALFHGFAKAKELGATEKALIFTESRRTQNYLISLLAQNGYQGQIVLFNGTNSDPLSKAIYTEWVAKHKGTDRVTGSKSADMRAALVDHFKLHAKIMIATEAGAEGINLQFCSMIVNYDLPWNPQRIEQRIGRCHRYGQQHDVVVINFINRKNAADQRVFELLDQKFKLFSGVFGASDEVLGVIESGVEFEKRIAAIYQNCRTVAEIDNEFLLLQAEMETQVATTLGDTRKKLLENFDADVHDRLRVNLSNSREYLNKFDTMLWRLTRYELADRAEFDDENFSFHLRTPIKKTGISIPAGAYTLSRIKEDARRYRIGHPLAQQVIAQAKQRAMSSSSMIFDYSAWAQTAQSLDPYRGKVGTLTLGLLSINGSDAQDHLILCAITDAGDRLPVAAVRRLFDIPARVVGKERVAVPERLKRDANKQRKTILEDIAQKRTAWFDEEIDKLNYWAEDRRKGLKADLKEYDDQIALFKKEARSAGSLPEKLALQKKLRDLDKKRDGAWKEYDEAAKQIEMQKDRLLDTVEDRLKQTVEEKTIFTVRWELL